MTVDAPRRTDAPRSAALQDRDRERATVAITRRNRVEILRLPYCRLCGGATGGLDQLGDDVVGRDELACVCERQKHALVDRVARIRERRGTPRGRR